MTTKRRDSVDKAIVNMLMEIIKNTQALPRDRLDALQILREMFEI